MPNIDDLQQQAESINPSNTNENPKYTGLYRAKVVDNKDPKKLGRVKCYIPELGYDTTKENDGVWCRIMSPCYGSNPDGKDLTDDIGGISVPPIDSFVFVMFERGSTDHGYIIGGPNFDKGIPTEAEYGEEYYKKSILEKTAKGAMIMLSDDEKSDSSLIIRGKDRSKGKRSTKSPLRDDSMQIVFQENKATGKYIKINDGSKHVFEIHEDNGTITLTNNRGDFVKITDTNNIELKTSSGSQIKMDNNVSIKSSNGSSIFLDGNVSIKSSSGSTIFADNNISLKAANGGSIFISTGISANSYVGSGSISINDGINIKGSTINLN